jgi:hypothetical protein
LSDYDKKILTKKILSAKIGLIDSFGKVRIFFSDRIKIIALKESYINMFNTEISIIPYLD